MTAGIILFFATYVMPTIRAYLQYRRGTGAPIPGTIPAGGYSTLRDIDYEYANYAEVRALQFGFEEPDGPREFIADRDFTWIFAYYGGESAPFPPKGDDIKRAIVWPVRIIGRLFNEKYTDNTCGGAQVHPRIVMTLCACVFSFSHSYLGQDPVSWIPERFRVSRLSDPEFDIRAPHLVASRESWDGYIERTGGDPLTVEVSKKIYPTQGCSLALNAYYGYKSPDFNRFKQYRSVALLRLNSDLSHPADVFNEQRDVVNPVPFGELPAYNNYVDAEQPTDMWRVRPAWKLQLAAYDQSPCDEQNTKYMAVRGVQPNLISPFEKHSLVTKWSESNQKGHGRSGLPGRYEEMNSCNYTELFNAYSQAKKRILRLGPFHDDPLLDDPTQLESFAENLTYAMESLVNKSYVACLTLTWGSLCDAPPGSPIMYDFRGVNYLYGLSITRPSKKCKPESVPVKMFALTLAPESPQHNQTRREIRDLMTTIATEDEEELHGPQDETPEPNADDYDPILVNVGGSLDPDLIDDMTKIFQRNDLFPPNIAETFNRCSRLNFPLAGLSMVVLLGSATSRELAHDLL